MQDNIRSPTGVMREGTGLDMKTSYEFSASITLGDKYLYIPHHPTDERVISLECVELI